MTNEELRKLLPSEKYLKGFEWSQTVKKLQVKNLIYAVKKLDDPLLYNDYPTRVAVWTNAVKWVTDEIEKIYDNS